MIARREAIKALEGYLKEGCDHYDTKDEDANGFETLSADRVGVRFLPGDEFGGRPYDGCGEEIQGGVDQGG